MLFQFIEGLERDWPGFNQVPLTPDDVLAQAARLNIEAIPDASQEPAASLLWNRQRYIFYAPHLPQAELTLTLGHELGHHLLGHLVEGVPMQMSLNNAFHDQGQERDASTIGLCCLIPRTKIETLLNQSRLDPQSLYHQMTPIGEPEERFMWQACTARLRTYEAFMAP